MILRKNIIDYGNPVNRSAPLNRGLVAWVLPLRTSLSGSRGINLCGNNHGTATGNASLTSGATMPTVFGAWNIPGSGAYLNIPFNESHNTTGDFSASIWFCATSFPATYNALFRKGGSSTTGVAALYIKSSKLLWYGNEGRGAATATDRFLGSTTISANVAYHALITYSSASTTMNGYLNGISDGSAYTSAALAFDSSADLYLGADPYSQYCVGPSTDFRFWTRCLSADEAWQLYNASRTGYVNELNRISRPIGVKAAAGSSFKAAWARNRNQVIGVTGAA